MSEKTYKMTFLHLGNSTRSKLTVANMSRIGKSSAPAPEEG